jgi:thioredoxin-related protein
MSFNMACAADSVPRRDPMLHFFESNTGDLRHELYDAKARKKMGLFLMYEQQGCPLCIYMKEHVLNRVDIQELYRKFFVNFSIDINGTAFLTNFTNTDMTEKEFSVAGKVRGTPTFAFHDLDGTEVVRNVGPIRDVSEFKLLAQFINTRAYQSSSFNDYKKSVSLK